MDGPLSVVPVGPWQLESRSDVVTGVQSESPTGPQPRAQAPCSLADILFPTFESVIFSRSLVATRSSAASWQAQVTRRGRLKLAAVRRALAPQAGRIVASARFVKSTQLPFAMAPDRAAPDVLPQAPAAVESMNPKASGMQLYREVLGSPKYVVAPMVDQSELAWRILSRLYGAELCYTPMIHSRLFSDHTNTRYRKEQFDMETGEEGDPVLDRPLIAQFCANDPDIFLAAVKVLEGKNKVDAVDLNCGCPQGIASRGKYGAFLMEDWPLIGRLGASLAHCPPTLLTQNEHSLSDRRRVQYPDHRQISVLPFDPRDGLLRLAFPLFWRSTSHPPRPDSGPKRSILRPGRLDQDRSREASR